MYFHLRGGIGDCAANRVAIMQLRRLMPDAVFYFFTETPHAAEVLFVPDDKHVFLQARTPLWYRYDLAFEICLSFKTVHVNWARVKSLAPQLIPVLKAGLARQEKLKFLVGDNYLTDEVLGRFMAAHRESQLVAQSYLSGLDFDTDTTGLLPPQLLNPSVSDKYGLNGKRYVTIHSGVNSLVTLNGRRPLKCWPEEKWREFAALFKAQFPDILLVQLGGKNSPVFDFADICLAGKTALNELPALLNGALLHVDGESGLVQLTRWLNTKAVVFFAHTSVDCFGLKKNRNLTAGLCRPCMWLIGPNWYFDCALGYASCKNLDALSAQSVMQAVCEELEKPATAPTA